MEVIAEEGVVEEVSADEVRPRRSAPSRGASVASAHEAEARRCEKTDAARATALYRQAILEYLESSEDPLGSESVRRDLQRVFDRLSLVLKRSGQIDDAIEEIDSAAYLGLVDDDRCGTASRREALSKRRDTLRRTAPKFSHDER